MTLDELLKFVRKEHDRIIKYYGVANPSELKYPIMVKVTEEVGELAEAVLSFDGLQRKEKLKKVKDVPDEIADVIITTLILANNCGVDIKKTLQKAIEKRNKRSY